MGESPSSAADAAGLTSEGFTQLWGLLFGETDRFVRDNGHAVAGLGAAGDGPAATEWAWPPRRWRDQLVKQK